MAWDDFSKGAKASLDFRITSDDMDTFARLSGDFSPVHADDAFARRQGFRSRIVFGGLVVAKVSQLIGMHLPGSGGIWTGLEMDFRAPLYIDETATLQGEIADLSDSTRMLRLKLRVETADRCIATGSAEAIYRSDG